MTTQNMFREIESSSMLPLLLLAPLDLLGLFWENGGLVLGMCGAAEEDQQPKRAHPLSSTASPS